MTDDIPEGWTTAKLGTLTTKVGSGATPRGGSESYVETGSPLIRSQNVRFEGFDDTGLVFLSRSQAKALDGATVCSNDVLLNITGASIGRVTQAPPEMENARVNQHVCIIRPVPEVTSCFLASYLASPAVQAMIWSEQYGVTRQALTKEQILTFEIPVAPFAEQQRIVAKIEALVAKVRSARERIDKIPAILKRFRLAVLAAACDGRLTSDWRQRHDSTEPIENVVAALESAKPSKTSASRINVQGASGEIDLPDIPDSWRWVGLGQVALFVTDGDHNPPKRVQDGVPHLTARNVKRWSLTTDGCTYITAKDFGRTRQRYEPCEGDVIVTCVGTLGQTAIVPNGLVFSADRNLAAVRLLKQFYRSEILQYVLNAPPWSQRLSESSGSTAQPHLYLGDLRILAIPLMSPLEQDEIVKRVEALLLLAERLEGRYLGARAGVGKLTQSILAKAFRGELVPTEAELARSEGRSYETAEELLAGITASNRRAEPIRKARAAKTGG